jgi:two-component sensor histidine kinase
MNWLLPILHWRARQPAWLRWLAVVALYAIAVSGRLVLGSMYGALPALEFYPILLLVTVLFGRVEALVLLGATAVTAAFLFIEPALYLQPLGWLLVGCMTVAMIDGLVQMTQRLEAANERQRILFRELQHRVANILQTTVSTLEQARRALDRSPDDVPRLLEEGTRRIQAAAEVHRRLSDPLLFQKELRAVLRDAIMTVISGTDVEVEFDMDPIGLTFDQMSIITMMVIELATNAQKHVFERQLGNRFEVSLKRLPYGAARLSVRDDGPGWAPEQAARATLGQTILRALADELAGALSTKSDHGTEVNVVFRPWSLADR